jgi:hypothetical protein
MDVSTGAGSQPAYYLAISWIRALFVARACSLASVQASPNSKSPALSCQSSYLLDLAVHVDPAKSECRLDGHCRSLGLHRHVTSTVCTFLLDYYAYCPCFVFERHWNCILVIADVLGEDICRAGGDWNDSSYAHSKS